MNNETNVVGKTNIESLTSGIDFFISRARLAFAKLKLAFSTTPIVYHFDLEYHIQIGTNISRYAISGIFSQLTSDNLG